MNEESSLEPSGDYSEESGDGSLYVMPGFGDYSGFLNRTEGIGEEDYRRYLNDLGKDLQNSVERGDGVGVMYPEEFRKETEQVVEDYVRSRDIVYIPVFSQVTDSETLVSSQPVSGSNEEGIFSGESRYAGLIDSLDESRTLTVNGELGTQAYENAVWMAEEISEKSGRSFEVTEGIKFPENAFLPVPLKDKNVSLDSEIIPEKLERKIYQTVSAVNVPQGSETE
ncbi:MAG: hypothetical protein ABEJ36_03130 [Candidatus Nanosalina sp.]